MKGKSSTEHVIFLIIREPAVYVSYLAGFPFCPNIRKVWPQVTAIFPFLVAETAIGCKLFPLVVVLKLFIKFPLHVNRKIRCAFKDKMCCI